MNRLRLYGSVVLVWTVLLYVWPWVAIVALFGSAFALILGVVLWCKRDVEIAARARWLRRKVSDG